MRFIAIKINNETIIHFSYPLVCIRYARQLDGPLLFNRKEFSCSLDFISFKPRVWAVVCRI